MLSYNLTLDICRFSIMLCAYYKLYSRRDHSMNTVWKNVEANGRHNQKTLEEHLTSITQGLCILDLSKATRKTQILNLGDSDFYRTRLTHSLEVAQIAAGIVRQLGRIDHPLSHPSVRKHDPGYRFAHDLGHPLWARRRSRLKLLHA